MPGVLLCLMSASCFGSLAILATQAYEAGVEPLALLAVRFAIAGVAFAVLLRVRRARTGAPVAAPGRRLVLGALALGAVGYAIQSGLFFGALTRVDPGPLELVLSIYPVLVVLGAAALGRERLTTRRVGAVLVASAGLVGVLLGAGGSIDAAGAAMGLGAAVTYAAYILIADGPLGRLEPLVLSTLVCAGAAVSLTVLAGVAGQLDAQAIGASAGSLVAIGLLSVAAIGCFFAGLRRVGPSAAAILSTLEPVVTAALAWLALGQDPRAVQVAGGALVLGAVVVLQRRGGSARSPVAPAAIAAAPARGEAARAYL